MGLTASSTGKKLLKYDFDNLKEKNDFTITLAGNPNVGKSTVFNALTGLNQHTGNWPGKTVENSFGSCTYKNKSFLLVDIPGTYSLMSNSEEEEIARDYICFGNSNATVVVVDATCIERNLNLVYQVMEITPNIIVCVNLLDEAKKKGIHIDLDKLSRLLGVPVVGTIAHKKKTLNNLLETIYKVANKEIIPQPNKNIYFEDIETCIAKLNPFVFNLLPESHKYLAKCICLKLLSNDTEILDSIEKNLDINLHTKEILDCLNDINYKSQNIRETIISSIVQNSEIIKNDVCTFDNSDYNKKYRKIDKILTSKKFGIPIMLIFLGIIFWITIVGANYPSSLLSTFFNYIEEKLLLFADFINCPTFISNILIHGMYKTVTWVVAVMLPPMAIFFPLFTILEDIGVLPRIAFNLDSLFKKACTSGKQALTMCMGFGCNAAGVVGTRIIGSPRERIIAAITNAFVPCNGRFPFLIAIATIFIASRFTGITASIVSTLTVLAIIILGIILTLLISKILSKTILKGMPSSFVLELPPYRKPEFGKIIVRSIFDRTLYVLGRSIAVAAPTGIVIWLFANISFGGTTILSLIANFLDPFANIMGLDGYILTAFILGIPANEIVLPIILMSYMSSGTLVSLEDYSSIGNILYQNGWTMITAINVMIFTLLHFPCGTTLLTIKKETGSLKYTLLSFVLPTLCGIVLCIFTNFVWNVFV